LFLWGGIVSVVVGSPPPESLQFHPVAPFKPTLRLSKGGRFSNYAELNANRSIRVT